MKCRFNYKNVIVFNLRIYINGRYFAFQAKNMSSNLIIRTYQANMTQLKIVFQQIYNYSWWEVTRVTIPDSLPVIKICEGGIFLKYDHAYFLAQENYAAIEAASIRGQAVVEAVSNSQPFYCSLGCFIISIGLCMLWGGTPPSGGGSISLAIFGAKVIKSVEMLVAKPLPPSLLDTIVAAPSDMVEAPLITSFLPGVVDSAISLLELSPVVPQVLLLESAATTIVDQATLVVGIPVAIGAALAVLPQVLSPITSLVPFLSTELGFLWVGMQGLFAEMLTHYSQYDTVTSEGKPRLESLITTFSAYTRGFLYPELIRLGYDVNDYNPIITILNDGEPKMPLGDFCLGYLQALKTAFLTKFSLILESTNEAIALAYNYFEKLLQIIINQVARLNKYCSRLPEE